MNKYIGFDIHRKKKAACVVESGKKDILPDLNTTTQLSVFKPCFLLKSEARSTKSETISNVQNLNFRNNNADCGSVVV